MIIREATFLERLVFHYEAEINMLESLTAATSDKRAQRLLNESVERMQTVCLMLSDKLARQVDMEHQREEIMNDRDEAIPSVGHCIFSTDDG